MPVQAPVQLALNTCFICKHKLICVCLVVHTHRWDFGDGDLPARNTGKDGLARPDELIKRKVWIDGVAEHLDEAVRRLAAPGERLKSARTLGAAKMKQARKSINAGAPGDWLDQAWPTGTPFREVLEQAQRRKKVLKNFLEAMEYFIRHVRKSIDIVEKADYRLGLMHSVRSRAGTDQDSPAGLRS